MVWRHINDAVSEHVGCIVDFFAAGKENEDIARRLVAVNGHYCVDRTFDVVVCWFEEVLYLNRMCSTFDADDLSKIFLALAVHLFALVWAKEVEKSFSFKGR